MLLNVQGVMLHSIYFTLCLIISDFRPALTQIMLFKGHF